MLLTTVSYLLIIGLEIFTTSRTGVTHGIMGVHAVVDEPMPRSKSPHTLLALAPVLPIYAAGVWKSWRSVAGIALKPEIGSLVQNKNVISLVVGICKHGVDMARCGENLALFFPNHFS